MRVFLMLVGAASACAGCVSTGADGQPPMTVASETPAQASAAGEAAPSVQATAEEDGKSKVVCRYVGSTGSRLSGQRICRTRAQWDEEARRTQKDLGRLQHGNGGATVAN